MPCSLPLHSLTDSILRRQTSLCWFSSFFLLLGCLWLIPHGDFRQLESFSQFWIGISLMSIGFVLSWGLRSISGRWFWGMAIGARLLLLPMYPGDDVWRYLWEGYIQTLGFSPYHFAPDAIELLPYRTDWWLQINHPDVSAIYPPITQLGFRLLASITPSVLLFKIAFVLADLCICNLLRRRWGYQATLIYAWNPLILYSFAGTGHYDSWFILPLVAAWFIFDGSNEQNIQSNHAKQSHPKALDRNLPFWAKSTLLVGISVATKWISLPVLGFLSWQAWRGRQLKPVGVVILCGGIPLILSALPFCQDSTCPLIPTDSVFVSYGRSAELVPYFLGLLWPASRQVNWIYAIPLGVVVLWLLWRSQRFLDFAESYLFALLILSPIVHAWYFTWIVPFATATQNLGTRLISVSAFIYFTLPHRAILGNPDWFLLSWERILLWTPFVLGWTGYVYLNRSHPQFSSVKKSSKK